MMEIMINTPLTIDICKSLKVGDSVKICGTIYTARDAAHKRLCESIDKSEKLPFDINDSIIYYVGPTSAKNGSIVGSCGPTTSYRMDAYAPKLLDLGLRGMIGKGNRSKEVIEAIVRNNAIYFAAIGGCGALLSKCIKKVETICYDDLGTEALRRFEIENFPAIVAIDSKGNSLYEIGRKDYLRYS